ncbi:putative 26S proteasome non-ATPase regulatory subunit 12 [Daphnia magna]|uniref:Putative 26S proteasome non-ATPase regulatory subunit 12 n=1 Tax=Daphnia magna TaxID=35525 RepID=A0A164TS67_9CRUS|nr:putative 26S proteasome non-ATPase regulatory subunit 12 [Daphnia magna]
MEVEYSSTCHDKIPICKALAAEVKINEALVIYALAKQTRIVIPFQQSAF